MQKRGFRSLARLGANAKLSFLGEDVCKHDQAHTLRSMSPRCLTSIRARLCCCGGVQCISKDKITGKSDVLKAHSEIA